MELQRNEADNSSMSQKSNIVMSMGCASSESCFFFSVSLFYAFQLSSVNALITPENISYLIQTISRMLLATSPSARPSSTASRYAGKVSLLLSSPPFFLRIFLNLRRRCRWWTTCTMSRTMRITMRKMTCIGGSVCEGVGLSGLETVASTQ